MSHPYNPGSVSGTGTYVGGLVGDNSTSATVKDSYYNNSFYVGAAIGGGTTTGTTITSIGGITTAAFGSAISFGGMGAFTTFSSGVFTAPTDPWFMATVTPNGGTTSISAPILLSMIPVDTITSSGTSVYNGQAVTSSQTITLGGTTGIGPNVGTYGYNSTSLSAPATQTSLGSFSSTSGTWTITPLSVTATATLIAMTVGSSLPTLSGSLSTAPNLVASWTTKATSQSAVGSYAITPVFSYANGAVAGDFSIIDATANIKALTIKAVTSTGTGSGTGTNTNTTTENAGTILFDNGKAAYPPPTDTLVSSTSTTTSSLTSSDGDSGSLLTGSGTPGGSVLSDEGVLTSSDSDSSNSKTDTK